MLLGAGGHPRSVSRGGLRLVNARTLNANLFRVPPQDSAPPLSGFHPENPLKRFFGYSAPPTIATPMRVTDQVKGSGSLGLPTSARRTGPWAG
jgi:hypothetical protein